MASRLADLTHGAPESVLDRALDLPTIDLDGSVEPGDALMVATDRRTYEDRFAELGFGLGVVPRRRRHDDPWWESPAGMLAGVGTLLLMLWILAPG